MTHSVEDAAATVAYLWTEDWLDSGEERYEDPRGCYDAVRRGSVVMSAGCRYVAVRKESRVVSGARGFYVELWDGRVPLCDHMIWRNAYGLEVVD